MFIKYKYVFENCWCNNFSFIIFFNMHIYISLVTIYILVCDITFTILIINVYIKSVFLFYVNTFVYGIIKMFNSDNWVLNVYLKGTLKQ